MAHMAKHVSFRVALLRKLGALLRGYVLQFGVYIYIYIYIYMYMLILIYLRGPFSLETSSVQAPKSWVCDTLWFSRSCTNKKILDFAGDVSVGWHTHTRTA